MCPVTGGIGCVNINFQGIADILTPFGIGARIAIWELLEHEERASPSQTIVMIDMTITITVTKTRDRLHCLLKTIRCQRRPKSRLPPSGSSLIRYNNNDASLALLESGHLDYMCHACGFEHKIPSTQTRQFAEARVHKAQVSSDERSYDATT